jgi:hypothetical protein
VIDAKSREQAQTTADSGNRSQNRYDQQTDIGEHETSLNARAICEESRLSELHDQHQGAAERVNPTHASLAESGKNKLKKDKAMPDVRRGQIG